GRPPAAGPLRPLAAQPPRRPARGRGSPPEPQQPVDCGGRLSGDPGRFIGGERGLAPDEDVRSQSPFRARGREDCKDPRGPTPDPPPRPSPARGEGGRRLLNGSVYITLPPCGGGPGWGVVVA